jgi:hypothetical protein
MRVWSKVYMVAVWLHHIAFDFTRSRLNTATGMNPCWLLSYALMNLKLLLVGAVCILETEGGKLKISSNFTSERGTRSVWIGSGKIHWKDLPFSHCRIYEHKTYLFTEANNRPYVSFSGCLHPLGETLIYELVKIKRMVALKYYAFLPYL